MQRAVISEANFCVRNIFFDPEDQCVKHATVHTNGRFRPANAAADDPTTLPAAGDDG
jgi:hypothetical protein